MKYNLTSKEKKKIDRIFKSSPKSLAIQCCQYNKIDELVYLINNHHLDINFNGGNLLTIAARFGNIEIVELLLESKEIKQYIDLKNNGGYALEWANSQGHLNVIKKLVQHGDKIENNIKEIFNSVSVGFSPRAINTRMDILKYYIFEYKINAQLVKDFIESDSEIEKMFVARSLEEKLNNDLPNTNDNLKKNNNKVKI